MLLAAATLCLYPSFRTSAQTKNKPATQQKKQPNAAGTKPAAKHPGSKVGDVDQKDIDKAMLEVEQAMREMKEVEWPKVQVEIEKALNEIDAVKIQKDIESSMKNVDMKAIQAEIQKAMAEVQQNLKEVDFEKVKKEAITAINDIDMKAIEKELAEVKKINSEEIKKEMAKVKEEMARVKIDMKEQMANAGEQIKAAKAQLQIIKDGLDELEKDGLKKKGEKVNIEYKEGILYLNGTPQSKEVSDKYKKYFGDHDLNINTDNDNENTPNNKELIR
jgi:hypothetical protein